MRCCLKIGCTHLNNLTSSMSNDKKKSDGFYLIRKVLVHTIMEAVYVRAYGRVFVK